MAKTINSCPIGTIVSLRSNMICETQSTTKPLAPQGVSHLCHYSSTIVTFCNTHYVVIYFNIIYIYCTYNLSCMAASSFCRILIYRAIRLKSVFSHCISLIQCFLLSLKSSLLVQEVSIVSCHNIFHLVYVDCHYLKYLLQIFYVRFHC